MTWLSAREPVDWWWGNRGTATPRFASTINHLPQSTLTSLQNHRYSPHSPSPTTTRQPQHHILAPPVTPPHHHTGASSSPSSSDTRMHVRSQPCLQKQDLSDVSEGGIPSYCPAPQCADLVRHTLCPGCTRGRAIRGESDGAKSLAQACVCLGTGGGPSGDMCAVVASCSHWVGTARQCTPRCHCRSKHVRLGILRAGQFASTQ